MCPFHLAIFNDQGISLAAVSTKDGGAVERQIESPRKSKSGIGDEADLAALVHLSSRGIRSDSSACCFGTEYAAPSARLP